MLCILEIKGSAIVVSLSTKDAPFPSWDEGRERQCSPYLGDSALVGCHAALISWTSVWTEGLCGN